MGGIDARRGFWFQDARILVRLLRNAIERRVARLATQDVPPLLRVHVEAATRVGTDVDETELPRPLWDSVSYIDANVVVDETKLGEVSKEERLAFYARLRATAATHLAGTTIVPRLTTARGAQPNEDKWRDLPAAAALVALPASPPSSVATAADLAAEALFYLTSPQLPSRHRNSLRVLENAPTPALREDEARAALQRLVFDDELDESGTYAALEQLLTELGGEYLLPEAVHQLRGWIEARACSQPGGASISCETLGEELQVLQRYLSWNPESERLTQRLRSARPPIIETRLAVRPWRDVQPVIATKFLTSSSRSYAFIATGGAGKSFAIAQLHQEYSTTAFCMWIDATSTNDLERLSEALSFGAWAAARQKLRVVVVIDGLDHSREPAGIVSRIRGALSACTDALVLLAVRPTTWALISASSCESCELWLEPWPTDAVLSLPVASALPRDLIDLLRTPLLLDIYLRVMGEGTAYPFQPRNRHELISEYFARRILPPAADTSPARRTLIERLGAEAAAGESQWNLTGHEAATANQLVGEGLLIDELGRHRFRHVLLQDVAVVLSLASTDALQCADSIVRISSATMRHDALRSIIEAASDDRAERRLVNVPPLMDLLGALLDADLHVGDAIGDVVVGRDDVPLLLRAGTPLAPVLRWARSAGNRSWLGALAQQRINPRPLWLRLDALEQDLYELALDVRAAKIEEVVRRELAIRLRAWAGVDLEPTGWAAAATVRVLIRVCPDAETLQWLGNLRGLPDSGSSDLLSGLRRIAAQPGSVDEEALGRLVLAGYDNVYRGQGRPRYSRSDRAASQIVRECLTGGDGDPSLFSSRPRVAYRVLFEIVARQGEARIRQRIEELRDPAHLVMLEQVGRMIGASAELELPTTDDAPTTSSLSLSSVGPDGVVNDVPAIGWYPGLYELDTIWVSAARRLDDPNLLEIAAEEAARSRSLAARNLVAGHDAPVAEEPEWVARDQPGWPDDPLPSGVPEELGRAWHLLLVVVRARSRGIRSSCIAVGALRMVLGSVAALVTSPSWALQSLHIALHEHSADVGQEELRTWCERILQWMETGPFDHERAINAFEIFENCLLALEPTKRESALIERFAAVLDRQLSRSSDVEKSKLFFSAHRTMEDPRLAALLLRFVRTHPTTEAMTPLWLAIAYTSHEQFVAIARELISVSPHALPDQARSDVAIRLGVECCYDAEPSAWTMVSEWLDHRPASGVCLDDTSWRSLLDSLANGACRCAHQNVRRYTDIAHRLWRAWMAAPNTNVHGLAYFLFVCIKPAKDDIRIALIDALAPVAIEVMSSGDSYDLLALEEFPWSELPSRALDQLVDALVARILTGPPEPDEYRRLAAALEDVVESVAGAEALSAQQAERIYAAVQPTTWMRNREARCQQLQARVRPLG